MKIQGFLFAFFLISFIHCRLFANKTITADILFDRQKFCDSTLVELSGYYIKRFEKKKIVSIGRNRQNRLYNKPYKVLIDDTQYEDCFLPDKSISINIKNELHSVFAKKRNAVYLYCNSVNYSIFNAQFCDEVEKIQADTCLGLSSNRYYTLGGTDKYCYQVFYLSGKWTKGLATTKIQKDIFKEQIKYMQDTTSAH